MSRRCFLCPNVRSVDISLHKFPNDEPTRTAWFKFCHFTEVDDVKSIRLCCRHFKQNDFIHPSSTLRDIRRVAPTLKRNAIPSIRFPSPLKTEEVASTSGLNKPLSPLTPSANTEENAFDFTPVSTPKKRKYREPRYISEIETPDVATPRKARRVISLVKRINLKKNKKIVSLQKKKWQLKKRISTLECLLSHLKQNGKISENAADGLMV